jgi:hypothetical protein
MPYGFLAIGVMLVAVIWMLRKRSRRRLDLGHNRLSVLLFLS